MHDLFDSATRPDGTAALSLAQDPGAIELFEATLLGRRTLRLPALFAGFRALKAITFSTSVPALLDVVALFDDAEITFGSERMLSREAVYHTFHDHYVRDADLLVVPAGTCCGAHRRC